MDSSANNNSEASKRSQSAQFAARTTVLGCALVEFKVDYEKTKGLDSGEVVHSDTISAGGHTWRIKCYPADDFLTNEFSSIIFVVEHLSKSRCAMAIVEAFLMDKEGHPSSTVCKRSGARPFNALHKEWPFFLAVKDLVEDRHVIDGQITILCAIMVLRDNCIISVPPSNIREHLGTLLDRADGTDVSFIIDGETFHAHRAVLAARSSVFRVELLGSMAEATMPTITLKEIAPATFKAMLRFMYTDSLSTDGENELGDTPSEIEMIQDLLAAADRYALDRLKSMCAQKLWHHLSVDTVACTLACAEMYNIPELKNHCIDFFVKEENFKKAVLTKGFFQLGVQFPSVIDEIREKVRL